MLFSIIGWIFLIGQIAMLITEPAVTSPKYLWTAKLGMIACVIFLTGALIAGSMFSIVWVFLLAFNAYILSQHKKIQAEAIRLEHNA